MSLSNSENPLEDYWKKRRQINKQYYDKKKEIEKKYLDDIKQQNNQMMNMKQQLRTGYQQKK